MRVGLTAICTVSSLLTVLGYSYVTEIRPHTHFSMTYVDRVQRNRATRSAAHGLFLLFQLPHGVAQAGRSKTRTVKGIPACKQRPRTLSCKGRAVTAADQRESHHGNLHGCLLRVHASQMTKCNVSQARA